MKISLRLNVNLAQTQGNDNLRSAAEPPLNPSYVFSDCRMAGIGSVQKKTLRSPKACRKVLVAG